MSEQQDEAIRYKAQVFKVQTLVDGGLRVTLDLVEPTDPAVIMALIQAKQPGVILECANVAIDKQRENNAVRERPKRKSSWQTAEG